MPPAAAEDYATARRMMVDCQLRTYDITDRAVLAAFDAAPRERFLAPDCAPFAYADRDLPACSAPARMTLAPMPLARMIQALRVPIGGKVLDVAGGAGYGAALLAALGAQVTALEAQWPAEAAAALRQAAPGSVDTVAGALDAGHAANAPYDGVLVHGALEREPLVLISQLREGGRLICGWQQDEICQIVCFERFGGSFKRLPLLDAKLPLLREFAAEAAFVF